LLPSAEEQRIEVLERQVKELRRLVQFQGEVIEVLQTPPWKRWLWFVPQGWRPYTVGRWYGN
jgi:hypothetical protein